MFYIHETFRTIKDNLGLLIASVGGGALSAHGSITIAQSAFVTSATQGPPTMPQDIQVWLAFAQAIFGAIITIGGLTFTVVNAIHASNHARNEEFNTALEALRASLQAEKNDHIKTEELLASSQEEILSLKQLLAQAKEAPPNVTRRKRTSRQQVDIPGRESTD
jgi:hypothetical protein